MKVTLLTGQTQYRSYLYTMKITITEVEKFPNYGYQIITIVVEDAEGQIIAKDTQTVFDSTSTVWMGTAS